MSCAGSQSPLFQPVLRFYGVSPLYGLLLPLIGGIYVWFTCTSALQHASGRGRNVEGSRTGKSDPHPMTSAGSLRSGRSHRDENFPVASWRHSTRATAG